jgi:tetratricopeptide (TPR) repeat protein
MNARRGLERTRPGNGADRRRAPGGLALAALLVCGVMLGGCAMTGLARKVGLPLGASERKAQRHAGPFAEARERSVLEPGEPYWPFRLGVLYLAADSLAAAETAFRSALARNEVYAPALSRLSKLYFDSGRHAEAVRILMPVRTRPEAFTPEDREVLLAEWALHQEALGRADLAGEALAEAPGAPGRAGSARVFVMLRGDQADSAGALARAVLRQDPNNAVSLNNYGITRLRAGDHEAARRAFLDAIGRDPALPGPYYNLAILERFYARDDSAATAWFQRYWKRSHDDPDSLHGTFAERASNPVVEEGIGR